VIDLIIGGAGMAIPEMSMLASIFKTKLACSHWWGDICCCGNGRIYLQYDFIGG
jgi:hypothetical protein